MPRQGSRICGLRIVFESDIHPALLVYPVNLVELYPVERVV
jgi:hypothetical protein